MAGTTCQLIEKPARTGQDNGPDPVRPGKNDRRDRRPGQGIGHSQARGLGRILFLHDGIAMLFIKAFPQIITK